MLAIGNRGGVLFKRHALAIDRHGANAGSGIAEGAVLGSDRSHQFLALDQVLTQVALEERRTLAVTRHAGHLNVMHRQHHAGRTATLCQRRTLRAQLEHAGSGAAAGHRHGGRQQSRLPQRGKGFVRKAAAGVDIGGMFRGHVARNGCRLRQQRARLDG